MMPEVGWLPAGQQGQVGLTPSILYHAQPKHVLTAEAEGQRGDENGPSFPSLYLCQASVMMQWPNQSPGPALTQGRKEAA